MSSTILTPDALRSEFRPFKGHCWRVVESQYVISTVPLVDTLDEQARLEELLDETKPPIPPACRHLHPLLYTPFRYAPRHGSRFRRAGQRDGAFYTAERVETAIAEMAFYRVLFYAEAPDALIPADFAEYTAFSVSVATEALIDLSERQDPALSLLSDYSASQTFADLARAAGATGLRTLSVRCPEKGAALTWLSCEVFDRPDPIIRQTWRMRLTRLGVQVLCESPKLAIQFAPETMTSDPRTADFAWDRAA